MLTRTFENPLRTVVLNYHKKRKESAYEKSLVARYIGFLNRLHQRREDVKALTNRCFYERLMVEEIDEALPALEKKFQPVYEKVEELKKQRVITYPVFVELYKQFQAAENDFVKYHEGAVVRLNDIIAANNKSFDDIFNWFEEKMYDDYLWLHAYSAPLYRVNIPFALDTSCFYDEIDAMKSDWNKVSHEYERLYELRDETIDITNACIERMNALIRKLKELELEMARMGESWGAANN